MTNRLEYPSIYALAYGNGALHFMGSFDSRNSKPVESLSTFHYNHATGSLAVTGTQGLDLSCVYNNPITTNYFLQETVCISQVGVDYVGYREKPHYMNSLIKPYYQSQ